jgi:hypothetical protein
MLFKERSFEIRIKANHDHSSWTFFPQRQTHAKVFRQIYPSACESFENSDNTSPLFRQILNKGTSNFPLYRHYQNILSLQELVKRITFFL